MDGMSLTRLDIGVLQRLQQRQIALGAGAQVTEEDFLNAQDESWRTLTRSRERDECRAKLQRLGLLG